MSTLFYLSQFCQNINVLLYSDSHHWTICLSHIRIRPVICKMQSHLQIKQLHHKHRSKICRHMYSNSLKACQITIRIYEYVDVFKLLSSNIVGGGWPDTDHEVGWTIHYQCCSCCCFCDHFETNFLLPPQSQDSVHAHTTTFLKRKESRSGVEPRSFCLPA